MGGDFNGSTGLGGEYPLPCGGYPGREDIGTDRILVRTPVKFRRQAFARYRKGPKIGEHTEEVLKELGYSRNEIDCMEAEQAVKAYARAGYLKKTQVENMSAKHLLNELLDRHYDEAWKARNEGRPVGWASLKLSPGVSGDNGADSLLP